jgi:microcystin-dependent protein
MYNKDRSSCVRNFFAPSAHQRPTVGDTKTSAVTEDHLGWLLCDGRSLPKQDFYFLFKVIKYSFGGSGDNFNLPKGAGTVPAIVGTGSDANSSTFTFVMGQQVGEYVHTLTIPEIPAHNHGVDNAVQDASNSTISVATTGVYDSGHTHAYVRTNDNNHENANALGITSSNNNSGVYTGTSDSGNANIVDPGHSHQIHPAGGSQYHNNVQPTLPIGNLFIYCGLLNYGKYPFTRCTNLM